MTEPGPLEEWLQLIRSEFSDASNLRVTLRQAEDHWRLDRTKLEIILETFVEVGFLRRSVDGTYSRRLPRA